MSGSGGTRKKSVACQFCKDTSCVAVAGAPYCLLHYHAFAAHGKAESINVVVTSEDEAARQFPKVKLILREAMTDTLLRMHEYQQKEQNALRNDPLSILSMHAPSNTTTTASLDVPAPGFLNKRPSTSESVVSSKKLKKDDLWHLSTSSSSNSQKSTVDDKETIALEASEMIRQVNGDEHDASDDYLYPKGPPCSKCESIETLVKYDSSMSSMSGTKSEIWGNKDNAESERCKSTIFCKSCKFEKVEIK